MDAERIKEIARYHLGRRFAECEHCGIDQQDLIEFALAVAEAAAADVRDETPKGFIQAPRATLELIENQLTGLIDHIDNEDTSPAAKDYEAQTAIRALLETPERNK